MRILKQLKQVFGLDSNQAEQEKIQQQFATLKAIDRVMMVITFRPDGIILDANKHFLEASGYSKDEIVGKHHRIFMPEVDQSYTAFWQGLAEGQFYQGQYKRVGKGGEEVWLEASYNPVFDAQGKVVSVVKYATLITDQKLQSFEFSGQMTAINRVFGVIEFSLDGQILNVNKNFEQVTGYTATEVVGRHHRMFMPKGEAATEKYQTFWQHLGEGKFDAGIYKRIGKDGRPIWLRASYNPIFDDQGKPYKIVKYATDITAQRLKDVDNKGQLEAINKIMAVIEFDLQGNILAANENFLNTVGYDQTKVIGQHHSMFVLPEQRTSLEYKAFWPALAEGKPQTGVFKRVGAKGQHIYLQASYNPIFDLDGRVYKIVKYATDITAQYLRDIDNAGQLNSIQRSLGTIEFTVDGHILKANQNFLNVVGYSEAEISGKHHSMFMTPGERQSAEYRAFWEKLARGEFVQGIFKRQGKAGNEIWLQASYNPILDEKGHTIKVVKFATDITAQKQAENGLIEAVDATETLLQAAHAGDMTARISLQNSSNQIASLTNGINGLMDRVSEILLQVRISANTINQAANEISSGNIDLSTRTETQAKSLQQTASSMGELAETVKQNADNAKQANQSADEASHVAERGGQAVGEVVSTMEAINQSAKKIEDIISVIDGIAFQTNILALNAAVEAARAGEQGRGFAVVAGEVRNLAQRSATAAKEIKDLIADSVSKTAEGTRQVENAGSTMQEVVSSVQRVADIISEISAASVEQTSGIDQVNQAVTSMDETTQQNAALVEEAAAAAMSLVDQANQLATAVSQFNLEGRATQGGLATGNKGFASHSPAKPASVTFGRPSAAKPAASKPSGGTPVAPPKAALRTGTDDEDWEEF